MEELDHDAVEMAAHYQTGVEESRLATWGRLEFIRTMEILHRYLPAPRAVIVDVGGGPGAYALPLAAEGHAVHLLDPMALHVEQARLASAAQVGAGLAGIQQGDARELPWPDKSADVALLLGPLYHLTRARPAEYFVAEACSSLPLSLDSHRPMMAWQGDFSLSRRSVLSWNRTSRRSAPES